MTTDGHVAYFTRTGNPTYTQEIITFQEKETLNDDGLFKDSDHKLQDDQSDKTWQFQDSKDMQISRNRWRFGTVLFISTTVLCLVVTIYFATSSSNKSKNTHGHSSLQQKTENITNYKGFTETNGHTTKEDACVSSPCLNGGTCVTAGCSYYCICPKGITGYKCAVTPCSSAPCLNGGTCTPTGSSFICSCAAEYFGNQCQAFWLGGSDKVTEGVWVWTTSGQGFTVTNWHTRTVHEPNNSNGDEHCLDMHKNLDYEWNDDNCQNKNRFICVKTNNNTDAATKRRVMRQLKHYTKPLELKLQSACNQIKRDIKRLEKGYDTVIKELEKKVDEFKTTLHQELEVNQIKNSTHKTLMNS
ncbi:unnamed protein product [Mytilus edulis]|uniref:Uncharacterized protein n=1 Tax=Mytilus edulis TaxID=6550 RepID=A0A8S3T0M9_MYTED|nr:unnamed protein product [Mytilus edulis]